MRRTNGSGTVRKLSGKRHKPWLALLPATRDLVTGEYNQKILGTYKTRVDAERALNSYLLNPTTVTNITLLELYQEWSARHFATISDSTIKTYEFGFAYWKQLHNLRLTDITPALLQRELDKLKGYSKSTIGQARLIMSQLCKEAIRQQIYTTDYSELLISPLASAPKEKKIFTQEEVKLMWQKLGKIEFMEIPLILIYTGMRVGELASCKLDNINLEDRYILHGSKTKAGKNRIIPIPKKIYPIIEAKYKKNNTHLIERLGRKVSVDYLRRKMYTPAIESININQLSPQACRRTYATMLNTNVSNKQFITRILGHVDFNTTDRYYIINQSKELVQAVDVLQ